MCVISMVIDRFEPQFPVIGPSQTADPRLFTWPPSIDLAELRKLVDEFKQAVEAAKTVDRLTGQPDCVDPEKAKLVERVAELERRLGPAVYWVIKAGTCYWTDSPYAEGGTGAWGAKDEAARYPSKQAAIDARPRVESYVTVSTPRIVRVRRKS